MCKNLIFDVKNIKPMKQIKYKKVKKKFTLKMMLLWKVGDVYSINKAKDSKSKFKKWVLSWNDISSLQNLRLI